MMKHAGVVTEYARWKACGSVRIDDGRDIAFVATAFYCDGGWQHPRVGEPVTVVLVGDQRHLLAVFAESAPADPSNTGGG